jgi:hypothetical protein
VTAVHPPRVAVSEDHLVAWLAGYLAAAATLERDAYEAGRREALAAVAVNIAELDIVGGPTDRRFRSEAAARVRSRRHGYEERAQRMYAEQGRREYHGGPVAWDGDAAT